MTTPTRFIPQGSTKVQDLKSDAVAYIFPSARSGRPAAVMYAGKSSKPARHFVYPTDARREADVRAFFDGQRARRASKLAISAERAAFQHSYVVGDILTCSWGYDQTNVDAYEVVDLKGKHIMLRRIRTAEEATSSMTGRVVPQSGEFIGDRVTRHLAQPHGVKVGHHWAHRWNTHRVAGVPVGPSLYVSSYA